MQYIKRLFSFSWVAILLSGCQRVTNLADPANTYTPETTFQKLAGDYPFITVALRDVPESVHESKNIAYVRHGKRILQLDPPILFLISSQRRFSLGYQEMIKKMKPFNIPYQVTRLPDTPHSFWLFDPWLQPAADVVIQFLDQQLKVNRSNGARQAR